MKYYKKANLDGVSSDLLQYTGPPVDQIIANLKLPQTGRDPGDAHVTVDCVFHCPACHGEGELTELVYVHEGIIREIQHICDTCEGVETVEKRISFFTKNHDFELDYGIWTDDGEPLTDEDIEDLSMVNFVDMWWTLEKSTLRHHRRDLNQTPLEL